jgi:hypothetical protein
MLTIHPLTFAVVTVAGTPLKMLFPSSPFILVVEIGADVSIEKVLNCAHS